MKMRSITVTIPEIHIQAVFKDGSVPEDQLENVCSVLLASQIASALARFHSKDELEQCEQWGFNLLNEMGFS